MAKATEVLKPLESVTPSELAELFNKRQMTSYGLLQTCLKTVRDTLKQHNNAITKATVIVAMIYKAATPIDEEVAATKYDRKLKRNLKATVNGAVPELGNNAVELILEVARHDGFTSLLGIKPTTKTPDTAIKRYKKLSASEGSSAHHAQGWGRAHPDILNRGNTGNRVTKKKSPHDVKGTTPVTISLASQEVAKDATDQLVDKFTDAGCKFKDVSAFKSDAHFVIGTLLDKHTDHKMEIHKKKKA